MQIWKGSATECVLGEGDSNINVRTRKKKVIVNDFFLH